MMFFLVDLRRDRQSGNKMGSRRREYEKGGMERNRDNQRAGGDKQFQQVRNKGRQKKPFNQLNNSQ